MTAIDFPNSPSVNDQFTASGRTWKWNGTTWESVSTSASEIISSFLLMGA